MAVLLTSPTCKGRAPSIGSQRLSFQRPVSMCIRCRGLSPTRVLIHALICGPAQASSLSIQIPVSGQHHSLRGSKSFTYHVWGASCMLPHHPLKFSHLHLPLFCCHLTPSHARIRCVEKALPSSGVPPKTVTVLNSGSRPIHKQKTCRKQGECCQHWATHL